MTEVRQRLATGVRRTLATLACGLAILVPTTGATRPAAAAALGACTPAPPPTYTLAGVLEALAILATPSVASDDHVLTHDYTGSGTYTNPVIENPGSDIADPDVVAADGTYYLYPTGDTRHFRVYTSTDLVSWRQGPVVFTAPYGAAWAPDVWRDPVTGRWYLYYTSAYRVGVAVADRPEGPFADLGLVLPFGIDAEMFRDTDGALYLYFSAFDIGASRSAGAVTTSVFVQPMRSPTERARVLPTRVLTPALAWERAPELLDAGIAEGPHVRRYGDRVELTYSANAFMLSSYAVGQAWAPTPLGPFQRASCAPVLASGGGVLGPGHHTIVTTADGADWIVYHGRRTCVPGAGNRDIYVDRLTRRDDGVLRVTPTRAVAQIKPT